MWCLSSRSNEILALRFEDFEDKDNKSLLIFTQIWRKKYKKKFIILNYQVIKFKDKKRN